MDMASLILEGCLQISPFLPGPVPPFRSGLHLLVSNLGESVPLDPGGALASVVKKLQVILMCNQS